MAVHPSGVFRPISLRHGVRCEVSPEASVEQVLLAIGDSVGCENIISASRMNKAVVVFLKEKEMVHQLTEHGIKVGGELYLVSPLGATTTRVTVSNVPPFLPNDDIVRELTRFGKIVSSVRMVPLNCRTPTLKHVVSFRRTVLMFLNEPTLDVSFRVNHEGNSYMLYASTGSMKCFECGDIGHKRFTCPHRDHDRREPGPSGDETGKRANLPTGTKGSDKTGVEEARTDERDRNTDLTIGVDGEAGTTSKAHMVEGAEGEIIEGESAHAGEEESVVDRGDKGDTHSGGEVLHMKVLGGMALGGVKEGANTVEAEPVVEGDRGNKIREGTEGVAGREEVTLGEDVERSDIAGRAARATEVNPIERESPGIEAGSTAVGGIEINSSRVEKLMGTKNDDLCLEYDEEMLNEDSQNDSLSDISDICTPQAGQSLYSLDELIKFLDNTFRKPVDLEDYFPDIEKFKASVAHA